MKQLLIAAVAACLAVSVASKEVARATTSTELLVLTDVQDDCKAGSQVAVWGGKGKEPVVGCWFEAFDIIWLMFADGDKVGVPKSAFKKPVEV